MGVSGKRLFNELCSLAFIFLFVFLLLSLFTYSSLDPGFNQHLSPGFDIHNQGGIVGAYLAGLIVDLFGLSAWMLPFIVLWWGIGLTFSGLRLAWYRWLGIGMVFISVATWAAYPWSRANIALVNIQGGGLLGEGLYGFSQKYLHPPGAAVFWIFFFLAGLQLCLGLSWGSLGSYLARILSFGWLKIFLSFFAQKFSLLFYEKKPHSDPVQDRSGPRASNTPNTKAGPSSGPCREKVQEKPAGNQIYSYNNHQYPPVDILNPVMDRKLGQDPDKLNNMSQKLSECLLEFGVQGQVVNVQPGPVVTMFEFRPAPGIKINRIANLHDDLALALKARSVRIEAPIPGKDIVGVEIPNEKRKTVYFRDIIESEVFQSAPAKLPMALGQDIEGGSRVEDLTRMPHLLVAGATGAGKSVCLNSLIVSLLFRSSPEEMKLLLVDPKRIEMVSFADLPHLVHPVVTEMEMAKTALDWAVYEMERRYEAMASLGVRNIEGYNQKIHKRRNVSEQDQELQPLPYLVIIIDELADLMLTAGKEAEARIVRLAQLARAAGIHLILATQRPSVDVVTGLIKANFPARIAFQVSSKHDSRTILDTVGAEYLLGKGDMLFKSGSGKLERIHGAFLSDEEISAVIDFWKEKQYLPGQLDFKEWKRQELQEKQDNGDDILSDPLYEQAVEYVMDQGKASISMIQRQFRIGFNRAARFVEQMERQGVIGPQEGSKPRTVVKR